MATVPFDDLLADRQPDAGAGELFSCVQALEHAKDLVEVLRINSQSVVFDRKYPFLRAISGGGEVYPGNAGELVLDGIADQILK